MSNRIEERVKQLGLSEEEVEKACCGLVELVDGLNPYQTWGEYYKELDDEVYQGLKRNPTEDWFEPIWKSKINQFLSFCEMNRVMETLVVDRMIP